MVEGLKNRIAASLSIFHRRPSISNSPPLQTSSDRPQPQPPPQSPHSKQLPHLHRRTSSSPALSPQTPSSTNSSTASRSPARKRVLTTSSSDPSHLIEAALLSKYSPEEQHVDIDKHTSHPVNRADSLLSTYVSTLEGSTASNTSSIAESAATEITCPDIVVKAATPDITNKPDSPTRTSPRLSPTGSASATRSRKPSHLRRKSSNVGQLPSTAEHPDPSPAPAPAPHRSLLPLTAKSAGKRPEGSYFAPQVNPFATSAAPSAPAKALTTTTTQSGMSVRKVWVKRTGASPTIVKIRADDLVDEVKDEILSKFKNSLGRSFDAPDVTVKIILRDHAGEKTLNPDETICQVLDTYYPGGQTINEALIIDVPTSKHRSPRPSPRHAPRHHDHYHERDDRPLETGNDYFPPMPAVLPSPAITNNSHDSRHSHPAERAMSVLNTGHVPPLPSPGAARRSHKNRPTFHRQATTSPSIMTTAAIPSRGPRPRLNSNASQDRPHTTLQPIASASIPTPPPMEAAPPQIANPPSPRVQSPRPTRQPRKQKPKPAAEPTPTIPQNISVIDTAVPPINVLIVEDNHINLKILEQFIRRLKVRWQSAVNGREAVDKWRQGGFHLVLMDIQLPIMSGLEATREIRRLERVNNIGVFSNTPSDSVGDVSTNGMSSKEDQLEDPSRLFKSPVIIVALTASNLQSDRHEALGAGCNDFLTKPVNFVWLERKLKEWGCMQALIDFDGWRNWKDFAVKNGLNDPTVASTGPKKTPARRIAAAATVAGPSGAAAGTTSVNVEVGVGLSESGDSNETIRGRPEGIMV